MTARHDFLFGRAEALADEPTDESGFLLDDPISADGDQLDREERAALRRVSGLSTELEDVTEVAYAGRRIFASAFVRSHRLEPAIHLLRQVDHPLLRMAFPTTNRVVTHRLHAETPEEVRSLLPLIVEAHETVAGGTR